jgi:hypothetical protein
MLSKHLFVILSSIVIAQSTQTMELQEKGSVVVTLNEEKPHETLARHACSILNVHDKQTEKAIYSLLKGSPNESPERKEERNALLKKLSNSLEKHE